MHARAVLVVAAALVACGQQRDTPAPHVEASPTVSRPLAPEAAKPADLTPGTYVVVIGVGLMQVTGPRDLHGKPGMAFSNSHTGVGYAVGIDDAKDPKFVRAVISKAEAERRLKLLEDTTPVTDTRPEKARSVEIMRTLARGSDLEQLALLHAQYASTFAAGNRNRIIYDLEDRVLPELAYVLGTSQDELAKKLHAIHADHGTYAPGAQPRPPEPEPVPPQDPWGVHGHDYVGTFTLKSDSLVAGDPIYVTSKHDEPPQDVTKNVRIPAASGRWLCYLELDPEDPRDVTLSFLAIHESAKAQLATARRHAAAVGKLWVDSGRMSVVDAAIRDDSAYDDARLFGADDSGVIGGRGCVVTSGAGDGTYTTRVLARDGKAIYVHVDFTGQSRDFLQSARAKRKQ